MVATQIAAAPSVSGELFPAVSVPRPLVRSNAGFNLVSFSIEVSRRGKLSVSHRRLEDQIGEEPAILRRDCVLVAAQCEFVLGLAGNVPALGHVLGMLAHAPSSDAAFHFRHINSDIGRAKLSQKLQPPLEASPAGKTA